MVIQIEGRDYELRYSMKTVEIIENATGQPIYKLIGAMPTIHTERIMIANALYSPEGEKVSATRGAELVNTLIKEKGLLYGFEKAVEQIGEDCAFLFQES